MNRIRVGDVARTGMLAVAWMAMACGSSDDAVPPQDAQIALDSSPDAQAPQAGCVERLPCSFVREDPKGPEDPLQTQLGCGVAYVYTSADPLNAWVGTGSFCPDSQANRDVLRGNGQLGYLPGYCDTCLGIPPGKIFVFWKLDGPNCPSSCGPKSL